MKTLFITGGNGEIGQAVVTRFREEGFAVISPGSKELDCGSKDSIDQYFASHQLQPVDAFVHCAGINNPKLFEEITVESLSRTMQVNTFSFLFITQKLMPYFIKHHSRITAVSSIYGSISRNKRLEYATSKHGLIGMVQSLALELAAKKIMVNAVSPGFIATKLTYKNNSPEVINNLIADIPLKELGQPSYIAELIYFLCSDKNKFITGQDIIIDGGYLIGGFQQ